MQTPTPSFPTDGPLDLLDSKVLFPSGEIQVNKASTMMRTSTGRLLLAFRHNKGAVQGNDGGVYLSKSDDSGNTWSTPKSVYQRPGWHCMIQGGMGSYGDFIRMFVGGVKLDFGLGGNQPFGEMHVVHMDSRDNGETWSAPGPQVKLFPVWTEMYGSSNPHRLSDGRYMLACMGTLGRDIDWHSGVTFTDARGNGFSRPVIIAQEPGRDYSDTDLVKLKDRRYLAVSREHIIRRSVYSHSSDEGKTWSPIKYTGFMGANPRLLRLRSGMIACAYRDEDRSRRGVNISVSEDGGHTWRVAGHLYAPDPKTPHLPSYVCGYPQMVYLNDREIGCVLHTYPDEKGRIDLHWVLLRDRT